MNHVREQLHAIYYYSGRWVPEWLNLPAAKPCWDVKAPISFAFVAGHCRVVAGDFNRMVVFCGGR